MPEVISLFSWSLGEFGIVYKARMTGRASPMPLMAAGDGTSVIVAVKTLKGEGTIAVDCQYRTSYTTCL